MRFYVGRSEHGESMSSSAIPRSLAVFLLPSAIGVFLFLTPLEVDGKSTIAIGVLIGWLRQFFGTSLLGILVVFCVLTAVLNIIYTFWHSRPSFFPSGPVYDRIFKATPVWFWLRMFGAAFAVMHFFSIGPEFIVSAEVTGLAYEDIGMVMLLTFTVACILLPFLTDFGFMEFIGTIMRPIFSKLFGLPGRAAIDGMASIAAAAGVGVLITLDQYRKGFYTLREASVVATNFSICSIPFSVVVAEVAGVEDYFPWFLTGLFVCFICVLIMPRIPPLSRIPDSYAPIGRQIHENTEEEQGLFVSAIHFAIARADKHASVVGFLRSAIRMTAEVSFGVISAALALVVFTMMLIEHTPVIHWVTAPLVPILEFLTLPDAKAAAPGLVVGFFDQFLPSVIASDIESPVTKFVLAGLALTQLIFMTEMGIIILKSELPLGVLRLLSIFVVRTIIIVPIWIAAAYWLVG